jgi:hypothetical protein
LASTSTLRSLATRVVLVAERAQAVVPTSRRCARPRPCDRGLRNARATRSRRLGAPAGAGAWSRRPGPRRRRRLIAALAAAPEALLPGPPRKNSSTSTWSSSGWRCGAIIAPRSCARSATPSRGATARADAEAPWPRSPHDAWRRGKPAAAPRQALNRRRRNEPDTYYSQSRSEVPEVRAQLTAPWAGWEPGGRSLCPSCTRATTPAPSSSPKATM